MRPTSSGPPDHATRVVREGYQAMLISDGGTVIRMATDGIKRSGRSTQGPDEPGEEPVSD